MCTVTFLPRGSGYALGMNRDEKLSRATGLPPALRSINACNVICPSEPAGGTWIATSERGITFALINWYSVAANAGKDATSRGEIVLAVAGAAGSESASDILEASRLRNVNPFRLIGVFPRAREIVEWRWDLKQLRRMSHAWRAQIWISSGSNEAEAQRVRSRVFERALHEPSFGTLEWLRRLHYSHTPRRSALSICMHRADAATVSYTEVSVTGHGARMLYSKGPPCIASDRDSLSLPR